MALCGPLICCSQYWVEKYLGWISQRLHARNLAAESFTRAAVSNEAYKIYYGLPFYNDGRDLLHQETLQKGGFVFLGASRKKKMNQRMKRMLVDYLVRKYDSIDPAAARAAANTVRFIDTWKKVRFVSGGGTEIASVFQERQRSRPSHYIAVEMDCSENSSSVFYGRLLQIIRFILPGDNGIVAESLWNREHEVVIMDWATGLRKGRQHQVFKSCARKNAFRGATMEDATILRRLIGVVEHVVPMPSTSNEGNIQSAQGRGGLRTYFIDLLCREQHVLDSRCSVDGINRNLEGF